MSYGASRCRCAAPPARDVKERMLRGDPVSMRPVYLTTLEDPAVVEEASRRRAYQGPVF